MKLLLKFFFFMMATFLCSPGYTQETDTDNLEDYPIEENQPLYETQVNGYRILPTDETTGFAQTINVADETKTVNSVSQVLSDAVGVQVRNLGGLGSYGSASIRGSTSSQVPVYLDGVLLNAAGFSSVDLGDLTLDTLETIEIYRGGAPVALGASGIGGAISLHTRTFHEPITSLAISYGSWNTGRILAMRGDQLGPLGMLILMSAQGSSGDFKYLNHNGTLYDDSDDKIVRRENNEHIAYNILTKFNADIGSWQWLASNDLFIKRQGIAGLGNVQTQSTSLRTLHDTMGLSLGTTLHNRTDLMFNLGYSILRENFNDSQNEIGIGYQHSKSNLDAIFGASLVKIKFNKKHQSSARIDLGYDVFKSTNLLEEQSNDPQSRIKTVMGMDHVWSPVPIIKIVPALRGEMHICYFDDQQTKSFYPSPSLGVNMEVIPGLILRANGGRYVRAPDIGELFGDRGTVIGNRDLSAEVGINADAGITYKLKNKKALSLMRLDVAWFGTWVDDLIVYVQNSQNTVRPENVDAATILGAETSANILIGNVLTIQGNYTYLNGKNRSDRPYHNGKNIPGRPNHEVYTKIEVGKEFNKTGASIWADMDWTAKNYLDQANLQESTQRTLLGLGTQFKLLKPGLTLTVEINNLLNTIIIENQDGSGRQLRDYNGFPLPGRTIFATLHWKM